MMFKKTHLLKITLFCGVMFVCCFVPMGMEAQYLKLHFINVGMGDGILVEYPYWNYSSPGVISSTKQRYMVVDGGSASNKQCWKKVKSKKAIGYTNYIHARTKKNMINHLVITHPHDDHFNYIPDLLKNSKVDTLHYGGLLRTNLFLQLQETTTIRKRKTPVQKFPNATNYSNSFIKKITPYVKNIKLVTPLIQPAKHYTSITKGVKPFAVSIGVISAPFAMGSNMNDYSAVLKLESHKAKFIAFLTGDATNFTWNNVLPELLNPKPDYTTLLKIPHHGSDTHGSNPEKLYNRIQPNIAIISSGVHGRFKLPKCNRICGNDKNFGKDHVDLGKGLLGSDTTYKSLYELDKPIPLHCYRKKDEIYNSQRCTNINTKDDKSPTMTGINKAIFSTCSLGAIVVYPVKPGIVKIDLVDTKIAYVCDHSKKKCFLEKK
ncbi:MAG: hypothetical protein GY754_20710 [bacterium]|nr:hypothetical protein [bacterium]